MKTAVLVLALVLESRARADCPAMAGADAAALGAHDADARLAWIQARLARTSHRATIWLRGWEIGIVGATAVDLALIPILGNTPSHQIDFGLGAVTTIVGIVPFLFWRPPVLDDHVELDEAINRQDVDRCRLLEDAEQRLVANAASQRRQRAWYVHAGNVVLNASVTLLFGAFHHWNSGVLNGIGGALVGEAIIYTEPIDQIADLEQYRRGELVTPTHHAWLIEPMVEPHSAGLTLAVRFQ